TDQAGILLDRATALPEPFAEGEDRLVDIVEDLGVTDTRRALEYWRQTVDGPGTIRDQLEQMELRGISASESLGGMICVDGWMTTTAGLAFLAAIDAFIPPPSPDDTRTPRQRRHDALEDLARHFLDHGDTPTVGGEKPHINLVCDLPALRGVAGALHETENGHLVTVMELRALACDCSLSRIVLGPDGEIIDVGRRTRVVPTALRRALIARDRHCTWPECDRDPRWCDAHHIEHWANGGKTEASNLRLLCRYHHTLTHQQGAKDRAPPAHT
ncbi:MAG: endonuclease, partial [Acidimicrobiia bacterium]|nr:endonuclease [Acidimicrobiia bacterium]